MTIFLADLPAGGNTISEFASASSAYKVLRVGKGVLAWFTSRISSWGDAYMSSLEMNPASDWRVG
jgi:hypothetical protein